jgi:hypothetical protein
LKNYGEFWADDILPVAKEAHDRLTFVNVHEISDQGNSAMTGDAREKNMSDHLSYADWAAKIVSEELHKGGWRLADLLSQAVGSASVASTAPTEPIVVPPEKIEAQQSSTPPSVTTIPAPPQSEFGKYPANYKEIVAVWMKKYGLDASHIDWQGEPQPAERPNASGQRFAGYLVVFNTPDRTGMKTRSVLIRDGVIVSNSGFEK